MRVSGWQWRLQTLVLLLWMTLSCARAADFPLADGDYIFQHRYAEQPLMDSFQLQVEIRFPRIRVYNRDYAGVFPLGLVDDAELYWHQPSQQWILVHDEQDKQASEVGGCSDGPGVIDAQARIYWTC